jgi:hypothetical protein
MGASSFIGAAIPMTGGLSPASREGAKWAKDAKKGKAMSND